MSILFNRPCRTGNEIQYIADTFNSNKISGDGIYGLRCQEWFEGYLGSVKTLLTPSCTQALEMAALLIDIQPGDEVIMPSYTFVSTANAFVLRGARIVFVDIQPDTMNIDAKMIEGAITSKTKAIVPVHYAGVACDMSLILDIAKKHNIYVIEDAAQGLMAKYKNRPLGSLGHMAAFSFHETKNITSGGEGGLLVINDKRFIERAEIIREKGTNRSLFFRGMVDKYTWVEVGSSYLPSELQSAYLWGQLEKAGIITQRRRSVWSAYYRGLSDLSGSGRISLPTVPNDCVQNGHMFFLKCKDLEERTALLDYLKRNGVIAAFHYIPLHSAPAGKNFSRFHGEDIYTTRESERLVRLPLWYGIEEAEVQEVLTRIEAFYALKN